MIFEAENIGEVEKAVLLSQDTDKVRVTGHEAWREAVLWKRRFGRECTIEDADMDCYDYAVAEAES